MAISRQSRPDPPGTFHNVIVRGIEKGKIVSGKKDRHNFVGMLEQLKASIIEFQSAEKTYNMWKSGLN
ncbi:MAG: hypothetical protein IMF11_16930 [Proteobacteria bacterium]|nr:hypothetical protein [Pseudomonadota bacterium]